MTLDFILSTFFLLLTLIIVIRSLYLLTKNYKKFINVNYYNELNLLTALTIAICSHELVKYTYFQKFGFNPINMIF